MKTFDQQLDEWLALSKAERVKIMSTTHKQQGIIGNPEVTEMVEAPDYDVCFGCLPINKDV